MTQNGSDYAGTYAAMADEELLELARESATLVEPAQAALRKEIDRRGLTPELEQEDLDSSLYCPSCARQVDDPLTCGDCSAVICRVCGTPLRTPEDIEPEDVDPKDIE